LNKITASHPNVNRVSGYDDDGADEEKYFLLIVIGRIVLRFSCASRKLGC